MLVESLSRVCTGEGLLTACPLICENNTTMQTKPSLFSLTLALGIAVSAATITQSAAKSTTAPTKPAAQVAHGKALVGGNGCANCHGAHLAGRKGFAPALLQTGVLKEYNAATFARVMNTGETNDGGYVHKPMPVYHLKNADGTAIYAYLKTLK